MTMHRSLLFVIACIIGASISSCSVTEAGRAEKDAYYGDKPADIICWTYGERNFEGSSTGKVIYDEGGRLTFVDAANRRLTNIEGDCRVVYRR